ncbi:hypothetical protein [Niveispirillum cyanobacteriorum]|uniref:Uncharacterized protein n=1 Tax=Niveispirillum cyanobacteriorum TaxID=1612173 RepID=A0A2K9NIS7_9PROT|nr:hypothetical protein [Niveispirillum cyanobacteriorum]AUN32982.1 hypothetical protein C0V82_21435 [Niveispirillum cyanobacteriorum]GGE46459.1 lipoprotein [Niveispirillum cyanobacteriorum]
MPRLIRLGKSLPLLALLLAGPAKGEDTLRFDLTVGQHQNLFLRDGPVSAHLVAGAGRIVVAFPAGNAGIGLWTDSQAAMTTGPLSPLTIPDTQGRPLHGIETTVTVAAQSLTLRHTILSSIRVLRDFQHSSTRQPLVETTPTLNGTTISWQRDRLDGAPGFLLTLTPLNGTATANPDGTVTLSAAAPALRLKLTAASGETPLTPIALSDLLTDKAAPDTKARQVLDFLSYREKLMAGSWAYNTYFGRDTLMSLRLLMPVLKPAAIEAGLGAVLERLSPTGDVAHEEDVGEFAVLRHRLERDSDSADPIFDYKMVDDDLMLAPILADYLESIPAREAQLFLARRTPSGDAYGTLLARNLSFVLARAQAFAADPVATNLIPLPAGQKVGDWRDSQEGLAGGRYSYSVNAVLAPAALTAITRLHKSGLLYPYTRDLTRADALATVWTDKAPALFAVTIPADQAQAATTRFAAELGIDAAPLPPGPFSFDALSLDASGKPLPVMHSDTGFALLFLSPDAATLDRAIAPLLHRLPAGLMTDAGMVVANAAWAPAPIRAEFGPFYYHGAVIWSWQQALMAAGLERQLARIDLPAATRTRLQSAQRALWQAIRAVPADQRTSELWSWAYGDDRFTYRPFGQGGGDQTESNAAQLWSTVYLAVKPPAL